MILLTPRRRLFSALVAGAGLAVLAGVAIGRQASTGAAPQGASATDLASSIRALINDQDDGTSVSALERRELVELYAADGTPPLWIDATLQPTADARIALSLIAEAEEHGLSRSAYGLDALRELATALEQTPAQAATAARLDVGLSLGLLRLYRHLHLGRVDPRSLDFNIEGPPHAHDFAAIVRSARSGHRIRETASDLTSRLAQYDSLRAALHRYRQLAADPANRPPAETGTTVRPGEPYGDVEGLRRWLIATGDLEAGTAPAEPPGVYREPLVGAVQRFQRRHGLEPDGVLGRATQASLAVPFGRRVRQLELALERLRWLPDLGSSPVVAVNIPMFRLWAWDAAGQPPAVAMNVVVGRAVSTATPVLLADMSYLVFRPYWNVPVSIARQELVPAFRRDPARLERESYEITAGGEGSPALPATDETLGAVARGALYLRQRPGPHNALGLLKFVFPNAHDVYMHDTPAQTLFARSRRDFSHGCIRVEDPVALVEWVLGDASTWPRGQILAAMQGPDNRRVTLSRPVQVLVFYLTAAVMPDDGALHFAEDIYGHDARLDRVLPAS